MSTLTVREGYSFSANCYPQITDSGGKGMPCLRFYRNPCLSRAFLLPACNNKTVLYYFFLYSLSATQNL